MIFKKGELFAKFNLAFLFVGNILVCSAKNGKIFGTHVLSDCFVKESTERIMGRSSNRSMLSEEKSYREMQDILFHRRNIELNRIQEFRKSLPQDECSPFINRTPSIKDFNIFKNHGRKHKAFKSSNVQKSFRAARLNEVGFFPPDSMGAVGPSQFILTINGLIRSFDKNGNQDWILNINANSFFNSVRNGRFTSDPRIRYDKFSNRWFIIIITVSNFGSNELLLAVSDSGEISTGTVWSFFRFQMNGDVFLDYCTLGIDKYALYVGGATFSKTNTGRVIVINKDSVTTGGPAFATYFNNIIDVVGEGMYVPQGVDNFDDSPTYGYFIGVDNLRFGSLVLRRVVNPGSSTPALSGNIRFTVMATKYPIRVQHKGNKRSTLGMLDGIDDRLMNAHIRNGRMWTTHHIGVNNSGVSSGLVTRNAVRWYEIKNPDTSPSIEQSGTIFQSSLANNQGSNFFWVPSIMTSGQGTAVVGYSVAGKKSYIKSAVSCRFSTDDEGAMRGRVIFGKSTSSYNPTSDVGSSYRGRRWGDYSYTSVDPCDDMTFWTVQEYCDRENSWGVRVAKLKAGPPTQIASLVPSIVNSGLSSVNVQINGSSSDGKGFFDPGVGFGCRLNVSFSGGVTVNSVQYIDPETIIINISTMGTPLGLKNVTVTNPDGQSVSMNGALSVPDFS